MYSAIKTHTKPDGTRGSCTASRGQCPFGGDSLEHVQMPERMLNRYNDLVLESENGGVFGDGMSKESEQELLELRRYECRAKMDNVADRIEELRLQAEELAEEAKTSLMFNSIQERTDALNSEFRELNARIDGYSKELGNLRSSEESDLTKQLNSDFERGAELHRDLFSLKLYAARSLYLEADVQRQILDREENLKKDFAELEANRIKIRDELDRLQEKSYSADPKLRAIQEKLRDHSSSSFDLAAEYRNFQNYVSAVQNSDLNHFEKSQVIANDSQKAKELGERTLSQMNSFLALNKEMVLAQRSQYGG